jgi:WD40 repeat protein
LHRAEVATDPLVAALLLAELGDNEPRGGTAAALRVGTSPVPLAVLGGHSVPIGRVDISHDGKHVVTCGTDNCQLWPVDGRGSPTTLPSAVGATFTHDDSEVVLFRRVASGTEILGFALDGTQTRALRHPDIINRGLLLPDDTIVIGTRTAGLGLDHPGHVVVFDREPPRVIARHEQPVAALARHPDGRILSCAGEAILSGDDRPPLILEHDEERVQHCAVLPDGRMLTIAGNTLRLWPAEGGTPRVLATDALDRLLGGNQPLPLPGDRVAYVDTSYRVAIVSLTGQPTTIFDHRHLAVVRKLVGGQDFVATAGDDGLAVVEHGGNVITLRGHIGALNDMVVAADGRTIVTAGDDGTARVWRLDETPATKLVAAHTDPIDDVRFNGDGTRVASVSHDKTARIWDVDRGTQLELLPQPEHAHCVEWRRDDVLVAATDALRIYRGNTLRAELRPPDDAAIQCGDLSRDGRFAVAAAESGAYLFDVATRKARRVGETGNTKVSSMYMMVTFSPDGRWLVGSLHWDQVYVWPVDDSAPPTVIRANRDPQPTPRTVEVASTFFVPGSDRIVTADFTGAIRFWTRDGREDIALARRGGMLAQPTDDGRIMIAKGHEPEIQSIEPGGDRLVLYTRQRVPTLATDMSPDGRRAVTGDSVGVLRFWWITWRDLVARMRASTTACLTVAQRSELLEESAQLARERHEACERRNGR